MRFIVITAPEPAVSLAEMKEHLNVDGNDSDAMITALTAGAQAGFEDPDTGILGRPVAYQQVELELECGEGFPVRLFGPIDTETEDAVTIVYRDSAGEDQTVSPSDYRIDRADSMFPRLVAHSGWPYGSDVRIQCWVGLDPDDRRIGNFQSAIKLEVEGIFDGSDGSLRKEVTINSLLSPYRILSV